MTYLLKRIYKTVMRAEALFFKSLANETRLKILWLLSGVDELCVCDVVGVLGITQSKASRHLRCLYNQGWVTDRRAGLWMNYRITAPPDSLKEKLLELLTETLAPQPEAQALRGRLERCLESKRHSKCYKMLNESGKGSPQSPPEP